MSEERAARLAEALGRANERWNTRTSGTDSNLAFEDRRVLAVELGRVLFGLTPEQRGQAFPTERDEFRGGGGPGEDGFE